MYSVQQITLTQYMNRNGSDKRKREHMAHRNNRGEDMGERDNEQNNEGWYRSRASIVLKLPLAREASS